MSKITLSTDWHFGKSNGKFDGIILEGIRQQCEHAKKNNITTLVNLGDTLDVKQTISTSTLNMLAKAFQLINDTYEKAYILVGNHDMSKKTYDETGHNLHILSGYSNIELIDSCRILNIFEKTFYMIPYFPNEYVKDHQFKDADYLCGHLEVQGFMLNQFLKAEEGVNESLFEKYNHVFLGHFHKKQTKGNLSYIGNLCRFFYGEDDDARGWTILDTISGSMEFFEYQHPRMFKFKISSLLEIEDLTTIFRPGDNLKLVIDTSLKYSELEELKSTLILEHMINDLVLDDQYFAWDDLASDDDSDESEEEQDVVKFKQDQTYMEYILNELIKGNKIENFEERESIKFLKSLTTNYQE